MRATWMLWASLLLGCGDGSGGAASSGGSNSSTDGSGGAQATSTADGGTGGSSTSDGAGASGGSGGGDSGATGGSGGSATSVTTGTIALTRSATSTATTGNGGTAGGIQGMGGQGGDAGQVSGVGGPCRDADDCAEGLDCLEPESDSFQIDLAGTLAGPPGGVCTASCSSHDECYALDPNTLCQGITETDAYCMPFCLPGDGALECNRRADMVCRLLQTGNDGGLCGSTLDCAAGQVCAGASCLGVSPVCWPNCATDDYCPLGRFCDPLSGLCVDEEPAGAEVGEACDEHADCKSQACAEGICSRICTLGVNEACGEITTPLSDVCLPLYDATTDLGDMGRCWSLCDCASDCPNGTCISFQDEAFETALGRAGFCGQLISGDVELTCN